MKYNLKKIDFTTTHEFELAGQTAVISCDGGCVAEGEIATQVAIGEFAPVHVAGFSIALREAAKHKSKENMELLQNTGASRPTAVKTGDVIDAGACHNDGGSQVLCHHLQLNGEDITDYEYVDLSVRAAALALARKIVKPRKASRSSVTRPKPIHVFPEPKLSTASKGRLRIAAKATWAKVKTAKK